MAVKWGIQGASMDAPFSLFPWLHISVHYHHGLFLGFSPISSVALAYWPTVILASIWLLLRAARVGPPMLERAGFGMVGGGLLGNVVDRAAGNGVVDYLTFGPAVAGATVLICNLADLAMVGGAVMIGVSIIRSRRKRPARS